MTHWFLRDSERLKRERAGIEELSRSAEWLVGTEWCLDGGLCLDAVVRAHGHDYEVRVSFPALFPDAPLVVRPRNMQGRISSHQYGGADGPLCLEWGPDNWHRDITAVQMLESTYRLFHTENPLGEDRPEVPIVAPSRHQLTTGQELRGEWARWCESRPLREFLAAQPANSVGGFKFSFRKTGENWTALIHEAAPVGGSTWKDNQIPATLPGAEPKEQDVGVWFKTDLAGPSIGQPNKLVRLKALLAGVGRDKFLATDGTSPIEGFQRSIAGVLVVDRSGDPHLFVVLSGDDAYACAPVRSDNTPVNVRSPESRGLNGKKIGIVGLGSVGSKIAISLARIGVRNFYLVDHDVLLPENLQRHALDWHGITQHKVDSMAIAIGRVAADATVDVCRLNIAGQESNAAVSGALDKLTGCDLVVDATANPRVFNLLAAVARTAGHPMVWMEVFGGGMGGMVARSRPGADPTPQDMRGAYLQYCTDNPDPTAKKSTADYATESGDGEVLVASDADISIIAHHAVQFVPDCFVSAEQSKFPNSMYLIGLAKGWVFEAPFVNVPISTAGFSAAGWSDGKETEIPADSADFLVGLLQKTNNASTRSA
jgi:sulfur-carrier protein adenylyltransferase/sulfurtransferase